MPRIVRSCRGHCAHSGLLLAPRRRFWPLETLGKSYQHSTREGGEVLRHHVGSLHAHFALLTNRASHRFTEPLHHHLDLSTGSHRLGRGLQYRDPLRPDLCTGVCGRLLHRLEKFILESLEIVQRLLDLRILEIDTLIGKLL